MKKSRKAFTMIEITFVIVIIGIMAAVAIPKLASTRDDVSATTCVHEIGQFLSELSSSYTLIGTSKFKLMTLNKLTNIQLNTTVGNGFKNSETDRLGDSNTFTYVCDSHDTVQFVWNGDDMQMRVVPVESFDPTQTEEDPDTIPKMVINRLAGTFLRGDGSEQVYKF
ncbi:hypothetical protein MNB_SV-15-580 [hydrothermal vent metagenome]|uniref:Type II secretion envelope pseudopilin protein (PulG,guides folded protein to PulD in outer membrane) n=1 Tax=hydrothermal vent metagenome TaxID=652676 RepID=A0A1W1EJ82_9ZZZZ